MTGPRLLVAAALAGCAGPQLVEDPRTPRESAEGIVLLATLSGGRVTVDGTVIAGQHVDLDAIDDQRHGFRYTVVDASGGVLARRSTSGPALVTAFLDHWSEVAGVDILASLPTLGRFPVTVPRLPGAARVEFELRGEGGAYQPAGSYDLARADADDQGISPLVEGWETLHRSGPSHNRLDLVVVGDGYTAERMDRFRKHADQLARALLRTPPFADHADYLNIHRVDVVSAERGASYDCVDGCGYRDTAFGSIFAIELVNLLSGSDYDSRAIFQTEQWEVARAASVVPWDHVLVLVDSARYGGMAVHYATATTDRDDWASTGVHELGHTVGLLGDEYVYDDCIRTGSLGLPGNITDTPEHPPWAHWVEDGTKLPTPPGRKAVIGAFQGAFNCDDLYRPKAECIMRGDDPAGFCEVCTELLVRRVFGYADPVDELVLRGREVRLLSPREDLVVDWFVDGAHQGTTTSGRGFEVDARRGSSVEVTARLVTPSVREDQGDLEQRFVLLVE